MREQLDGGDVGVGVGDAPGHQRARVGLRLGRARQPRHEVAQRRDVQQHPGDEGQQQPGVEAADHRHHGDEVDQHEHQDVGQDHPHVAHRQRGLHQLGGDAAGELVLVEVHALLQQQAVEVPAQPHREVARHRLLLEHRLAGHQQRAAHQHRGQQQQCRAVLRPQLRRLQRAEPVDDAPEHGEQQRLEHADGGGEQRHQRDVAAQAVAAGPDEGPEAARRQRRRPFGIGLDEFFEGGKQRWLHARRARPARVADSPLHNRAWLRALPSPPTAACRDERVCAGGAVRLCLRLRGRAGRRRIGAAGRRLRRAPRHAQAARGDGRGLRRRHAGRPAVLLPRPAPWPTAAGALPEAADAGEARRADAGPPPEPRDPEPALPLRLAHGRTDRAWRAGRVALALRAAQHAERGAVGRRHQPAGLPVRPCFWTGCCRSCARWKKAC